MPENGHNLEFIEYALGFNDFDGGNPEAEIWICGIEPGGLLPDNLTYNESRKDNNGLPYWDESYRATLKNEHLNVWFFEQRVVKLLLELNKIQTSNIEEFIQNELYDEQGACFKINLYPLNCFRLSVWTKNHIRLSGFEDKDNYYQWCRQYRFARLTELVQRFNPSVLICTGKNVWDDFILAFAAQKYNTELDRSKNTISLPGSPLILTRHFNNRFSKDQEEIIRAIKQRSYERFE